LIRYLFKNNIFFLFISTSFVIIFFSTCKSDESCSNETKISGDIIDVYDLGQCYNLMNNDTFVIEDTSAFLLLTNNIDSLYYSQFGSSCDTLADTINFSNFSIIGYFASGFGCNVNFHKEFITDYTSKKYYYTIYIEECGDCNYEEFSMNWIIVPKLDSNFTIIYEQVFQ
jgi:hypothetical protein